MFQDMSKNNENQYKNLRLWNGVMGALHLLQGLIMLFLSKKTLFTVYLYLPKPSSITRSVTIVGEKWYEVNLGYVISAFLFLSALAHFITILPKVYEWYISKLHDKINLIRWYEYAISSSVMIFVIAALCNINDGLTLFLLVVANACMNLFGAMMELHNSSLRKLGEKNGEDYRPNWTAFVYGCFAGIAPWIVMSVYFFVSLARLDDLPDLPQRLKDALNTVRFGFPGLFVFFNLFAINMILQYKAVGKWKNYLFGEKVYITLSLLAKSFLAWFVWGGTLRP
jgi:Heliorhodopsin